MKRTWLLLFLGLFIILLPFLGFLPTSRTYLTVGSGALVFLIAFSELRRLYRRKLGLTKPAAPIKREKPEERPEVKPLEDQKGQTGT